ncbi:MAG: DUF5011 domain-containing protein, partial [Clostridium sp.]|nr:DUF5011 domain-containing protein [Clostridium sp.]
MKKVKLKVKILAGAVVVATVIAAGHTYIANANYNTNTSESSIQLNVEKQDRDTIKIYLSNFGDLTKSLQLSVKIDGGNVKFKEESIKWLMDTSEKKIETNYIMNSDKNKLDLFMVSKDIINSENGVIEICEIDVSKGESILDKLFKSNDGSYRVVPNVVDGEAYSYVRDSTNKRIGGYDIANSSNSKLTINEEPVIKLKDNYSIIDNKIVILKETVFKISDYIEAFDGDGKEIENIEYSGKVDNKKAGSYKITCKATDSFGDSTTLEATVIVENFTKENIPKPVIYGAETPLEIVIGKDFDLKDGISAVDYSGRKLDVKITGDYYTDTPGEYTVTYTANDRFENTTTAERTLLVSKQSSGSEGDSTGPGGNTGGSGESGDITGPGGDTGGSGGSGDVTG